MKRALLITLAVIGVVDPLLLLGWTVEPPVLRDVAYALRGQGRFVFGYPWLLLALVPLTFLSALAWVRARKREFGTFAFTRGDLVAGAPRTLRTFLRPLPGLLRTLALLVLVVAAARPQIATESQRQAEGIDIYLVLDMSGSMVAIDLSYEELRELQVRRIAPMNRFDIARDVLQEFVARRQERTWSDRIGMVIFARDAFPQFPLTVDYETIQWLLERLQLNDIDASQTAIGNALGLAITGLIGPADADAPDDIQGRARGMLGGEDDADDAVEAAADARAEDSRIIILITDGSERGGNFSALSAAQVAADQNIQIYPVLVGRQGQVLVPERSQLAGFGQQYSLREYPVDEELLRQLAEVSGGRFFRAENREELETTLEGIIGEYETQEYDELVTRQRDDVFYPFLWLAFFLLASDLFLRYAVIRKFP
jgi:Ca-activated chloride channel family protein